MDSINQPGPSGNAPRQGGEEHSHSSQWVVTVVVILVLLLLGLWLYNFVGKDSEPPNEIISSVPEGEVVTDFPQELLEILEAVPPILAQEENPTFRESYSVTYRNNDQRQPVVRYTSSLSLGDNVAVFATFFGNSDDWNVIHFANPETTELTSFYARHDDGGEVNVTFIPETEEAAVSVEIAYLAPSDPSQGDRSGEEPATATVTE